MEEVEVRVLFFAKARELIGQSSALVRLPARTALQQIKA
jgi:hypothetical protein